MLKNTSLINLYGAVTAVTAALFIIVLYFFKLNDSITRQDVLLMIICAICSVILYRLNEIYWMMKEKR